MNKQKIQLVGVVAILIIGALFVGKSFGGSSSSAQRGLLIVPRPVERRTLEDVLNVSGEVRRDETKTINSPVDGQVSDVNKKVWRDSQCWRQHLFPQRTHFRRRRWRLCVLSFARRG